MSHYLTLKELPESERPYEKCERFGPEALSDAELLAVIIRSGTKKERAVDLAIRVLDRPGGKKGLSRFSCTCGNASRLLSNRFDWVERRADEGAS